MADNQETFLGHIGPAQKMRTLGTIAVFGKDAMNQITPRCMNFGNVDTGL